MTAKSPVIMFVWRADTSYLSLACRPVRLTSRGYPKLQWRVSLALPAGRVLDPFLAAGGLGEGAGLNLCPQGNVVAIRKGVITMTSGPGMGLTFDLYLPKYPAPQPDSSDVYGEDIPKGHERVLLIDDEEAQAEMGAGILTELGYRVLAKTNSREALVMLEFDPFCFDLIATDQNMPEMTGIDLAAEVFTLRRDIPVILCMGFGLLIDVERARNRGIKAFAMKPLTKREIARTVREVLEGREYFPGFLPFSSL